MKKIIIFLCCFFSGCFLFSQELEQKERHIPVEKPELQQKISSEVFDISPFTSRVGPFDVRRYMIPITIMNINVSTESTANINFLAMSEAKAQYKESLIRESDAPERQLKQIKSQIKVFGKEQKENWEESDDKLHFRQPYSPYNRRWDNTFHHIRRSYRMSPYDFYTPSYYNRPYRSGF